MRKKFTKLFRDQNGLSYRITATAELTTYFSLTGDIYRWFDSSNCTAKESITCGCIHDDISKHFPELQPYIKWHLCGLTEPMHYIANTLYHAGNRDCHGLLKDEKRQIINGRTKEPCWELVAYVDGKRMPLYKLERMHDSAEAPTQVPTLVWEPLWRIGEGKERELDYARSSAIWPDATDEELTAPGLKERLEARLPALMEEFHKDMAKLEMLEIN
jgi:hypothetical protein